MSSMSYVFGSTMENMVDDFIHKATGAVVTKTGQEYVLPLPTVKEIDRIEKNSDDLETRRAIANQKHRADSLYIWCSLNRVMSCEIKCYTSDMSDIQAVINREFFSNEWHVYRQNFGVRLIIVDLGNKLLRSLDSNRTITIEEQEENWEKPWTWIPNIEDKCHFEEEFDKHFTRPLSLCTKKILGQINE